MYCMCMSVLYDLYVLQVCVGIAGIVNISVSICIAGMCRYCMTMHVL
jgi:hypothetical protein